LISISHETNFLARGPPYQSGFKVGPVLEKAKEAFIL